MIFNNTIETKINECSAQPLFDPYRSGTIQKADAEGVNRLISAAVVDRHFCRMLLADPVSAIAAGYNGEKFIFSEQSSAVIGSIRVESLVDFAAQILDVMPAHKNERWHSNGRCISRRNGRGGIHNDALITPQKPSGPRDGKNVLYKARSFGTRNRFWTGY